eukprot:CAMPEP_0171813264 /NCGR_PEP_ID=MMETSP0991-20121206/79119_1 /TAXON_ID=483369 /ORGANISM="non described non described, Strain CCMP2098" /LENGTH=110 /DNA_ID=CAMNT_0012426827 /DNA_START=514 /DNA_END=845 /DNA_ORIENTATION=+
MLPYPALGPSPGAAAAAAIAISEAFLAGLNDFRVGGRAAACWVRGFRDHDAVLVELLTHKGPQENEVDKRHGQLVAVFNLVTRNLEPLKVAPHEQSGNKRNDDGEEQNKL